MIISSLFQASLHPRPQLQRPHRLLQRAPRQDHRRRVGRLLRNPALPAGGRHHLPRGGGLHRKIRPLRDVHEGERNGAPLSLSLVLFY